MGSAFAALVSVLAAAVAGAPASTNGEPDLSGLIVQIRFVPEARTMPTPGCPGHTHVFGDRVGGNRATTVRPSAAGYRVDTRYGAGASINLDEQGEPSGFILVTFNVVGPGGAYLIASGARGEFPGQDVCHLKEPVVHLYDNATRAPLADATATAAKNGDGSYTVTVTVPGSCAPYIVIDSRGSGSNDVVSAPGRKFLEELRRLKAPRYVGVIRNSYPAKGWTSFLGAVLQLPAGYHNSVRAGTNGLRSILAREAALCPGTKFLLTGYSQGAQVTGDVYQRGSYPNVLGVALFGDPYFNPRDGYVARGDFDRRLSGNLGARPPFDGVRRKQVLSFCHRHDPVCQGPLSALELARYRFTRHVDYDKRGEPERAARQFSAAG